MKLHYRFTNLGNVQLQLCAPPPGNTLQRQFLDEHGEGVFHLGFTVPDCDAAEEQARSAGLLPSFADAPRTVMASPTSTRTTAARA